MRTAIKLHEAQPSAILPSSNEWNLSQISLLPVLSQINTIASFVKVKICDFKLASTMSTGFLLLPASHNGSGADFFCVYRAEAESLPS